MFKFYCSVRFVDSLVTLNMEKATSSIMCRLFRNTPERNLYLYMIFLKKIFKSTKWLAYYTKDQSKASLEGRKSTLWVLWKQALAPRAQRGETDWEGIIIKQHGHHEIRCQVKLARSQQKVASVAVRSYTICAKLAKTTIKTKYTLWDEAQWSNRDTVPCPPMSWRPR